VERRILLPGECQFTTSKGTSPLFFPERSFRAGTAGPPATERPRLKCGGIWISRSRVRDDRTFPASLNGRFQGIVADSTRAQRRSSMIVMECTGLTITSPGRLSISRSKRRRYSRLRPELRKIDSRGLGEFVACGCCSKTGHCSKAFRCCRRRRRGSFEAACWNGRRVIFSRQEWEQQERLAPDAYYEELRQVFARNLPRYFDATSELVYR